MRKAASLVEVLVVIGLLAGLAALLLSAAQKVRAAAARADCANRLRQVALAAQSYHDRTGALPTGCTTAGTFRWTSWLNRLMPDLGREAEWRQAVEDYVLLPSPFRPPHRNLARPVDLFVCPTQEARVLETLGGQRAAVTTYLGVTGEFRMPPAGGIPGVFGTRPGAFGVGRGVRLAEVTDGLSATLLAGERPAGADPHLGWWYAGVGQAGDGSADYLLAVREFPRSPRLTACPVGQYRFGDGDVTDPCDLLHFWSRHPGGAHFALCDGSVRFLTYEADAVLASLATRAGGEVAEVP